MAAPKIRLAWAGMTAEAYEAKFNDLHSSGHRMIDVCISGTPSDPQYAACWVKDDGKQGKWAARHGLNRNDFEKVSKHLKGEEFTPTCVSVTGTPGTEIYAGVWIQGRASNNFVEYDLTDKTLAEVINAKAAKGIVPLAIKPWGIPSDERYLVLFSESKVKQNITWWYGQDSVSHQKTFETEVTKPGWRPLWVTGSQDGRLSSTYCDHQNGKFNYAYGLDFANLERVLQKASDDDHTVIRLQSYGDPNPKLSRYTVISVKHHTLKRRLTISRHPQLDKEEDQYVYGKLDNIMYQFMSTQNVRRAELAIGDAGEIVMVRGYTWAEKVGNRTNPHHKFLLANVSKAFCAAAIQVLIDRGTINKDTKVYPKLGFSKSALEAVDARLLNVTVQHLLDHYGGTDSARVDPVFFGREVSHEISGGSRIATAEDIVNFMSKRFLDYDPGKQYSYSNYGYVLLSHLIEHVSGKTYYKFLSDNILKPEELDVTVWPTDGEAHAEDSVEQEDNGTGPGALYPGLPPNEARVAAVYGGDGCVKEACVGALGLAANASTLVRFISKHAAWGTGERKESIRSGSMPGASTVISSRKNGLDLAILMNTRCFGDSDDDWKAKPRKGDFPRLFDEVAAIVDKL